MREVVHIPAARLPPAPPAGQGGVMRVLRSLVLLMLVAVVLPIRSAAAVGPAASATAPTAGSGFVLPLTGAAVVLTPFRAPATRYGPGHRGVDLAAAVGASVRAAGAGTVVFAGRLAGRGVVSIDHPIGLRTTYEPVLASVAAGQRVDVGAIIGVLEAGHPSCAPSSCLHWGARLPDGSYIDPMSLLTGLRVRLKPWDP